MTAWRMALAAALLLPAAAPAADYVPLPGGRFESVLPQGPQSTQAGVLEVKPFEMRRTPVTLAEYLAFVRAQPAWQRGHAPALFADALYLAAWPSALQLPPGVSPASPVVNVSWFAAKAFCESEGARLPTWTEWEYAAAADETRRDARSDPAWRQRILAWYSRPSSVPAAAAGGPPNAYGVSDLHGLAWEWVEDFNALFIAGDSRTQGDPDLAKFCGSGAINIVDRESYAVVMRIALLSSLNAADTTGNLGFRCARPLEGKAP